MKKKGLRKIIYSILNCLKAITVSFFSFVFSLFKPSNKSTTLKKDKVLVHNVKQEKVSSSVITSHEENPTSRIFVSTNNEVLHYSDEELLELITIVFCEVLELKKDYLNKKTKEFIKLLSEKIIPVIRKDKKDIVVKDKEVLITSIKNLLNIELEEQLEIEKSDTTDDRKIIIPIILNPVVKETIDTDYLVKPTFIQKKKKEVANYFQKKNEEVIKKDHYAYQNLEIKNVDILEPFNKEDILDSPVATLDDVNEIEVLDDIPNIDIVAVELAEKPLEDVPSVTDDNLIMNTEKDVKADIKEEKDTLEILNFSFIDNEIKEFQNNLITECNKENLEDKNYEQLEIKINNLLDVIAKMKTKKLSLEQQKVLLKREYILLELKNKLSFKKEKDIINEEKILNEFIDNNTLLGLESELEKLHIENQLDLNELLLTKIEDLELLSKDKAKLVEKQLLKIKLKKAYQALSYSSLLALPFIRNKHFLFFTMSLFVSRHLKLFNSVLKHKNIDYEPAQLSHIKRGINALDDSIILANQNIDYLNHLEMEAFKKFPELINDYDYLMTLNNLKLKLLNNQERMLKKKNMLEKYDFRNKKKIRKLKKKKFVA